MPIPTNDELRLQVIDFIDKYKMSEAKFGKKSINDSRFVFDLKAAKRTFGEKIIQRVLAFMDSYQKEGK